MRRPRTFLLEKASIAFVCTPGHARRPAKHKFAGRSPHPLQGGNKIKDTTLSIRISTDDLNKIRVNAEKARLSQSEYVIRCCLGQRVVVMDGLKDVLTELRRIGNNVNQLTVLANMGKLDAVNLDGVSKSLSEIGRALRDIQEGR